MIPPTPTVDPDSPSASRRRSSTATADPSSRSLFVRNLAPTTTTADLTAHFSAAFPLRHATAVLDPAKGGACKGYGFVTFADAEDAQRARAELDGSVLLGRKVGVGAARPRRRQRQGGEGLDEGADGGGAGGAPRGAIKGARAGRGIEDAGTRLPPRLIVRNLPWSVKGEEQLAALFRSYGKVKQAVVPRKKGGRPGELAGFGFVVLRGYKNAERAIQGVNGKVVDGRTVAVDWAVDRETWAKMNGAEDEDEEMVDAEVESEEDDEFRSEGDWEDEDGDEDHMDVDGDEEADGEDEEASGPAQSGKGLQDNSSTLFIRNLPFTATDDALKEHFTAFGPVRYARIVLDPATEKPRGTGFVCFFKVDDAMSCLKGAPKKKNAYDAKRSSSKQAVSVPHSILQNDEEDPSGLYTMDGRVLQVSLAVDRAEAVRLTAEGVSNRRAREESDKRRLYLLSEGTVPSNSPLYQLLSLSEIAMREASAKQRKTLIERNPALHLSLTRLSVRNIPRGLSSKDLKQLAREAVVRFAEDVKAGRRAKLSPEELARGGRDIMKAAEQERKRRGMGIVKQAKIVFESKEGSKVSEKTGAGRSRGYGFIEYYTHRSALMGLRWLNGHQVGAGVAAEKAKKGKGKGKGKDADSEVKERKRRLIVEFAIENAQVVNRRHDREVKAREIGSGPATKNQDRALHQEGGRRKASDTRLARPQQQQQSRKRKRGPEGGAEAAEAVQQGTGADADKSKLAKRQQIIAKKRMARRMRKKGAKA
ncbi:hypothetical protein BDY21DRAFT_384857 [Lineolata rhizophorae]|uniref:RRM domain-containing protein n=1 Tax=Lineolata rhizophorae TaxID=578093 RepID=A0A6A6P572_9PEZI|nr:hypothetical protein BDY21DRAFT_384857 [Lineolata rhizophorae]